MITAAEKYLLNNMNSHAYKTQLGTLLYNTVTLAEVKWDYSTDGEIAQNGEFATGVYLPDNAIVLDVLEDMMADSTGDTATCQLLVGSGGTAITATNVCDGTDEVVISSTGIGTKTTAKTQLYIAEGNNEAINSGKLRYYVMYVISD